jgi:NTP pyrophosphatase (non-canonical NTP hydrolase)
MDEEVTIAELKRWIVEFNAARDWEKYHRPKDLVLALIEELGELARVFKWRTPASETRLLRKPEVAEEIADLFIYLFALSHRCGIDISDEIRKKLQANSERYPARES